MDDKLQAQQHGSSVESTLVDEKNSEHTQNQRKDADLQSSVRPEFVERSLLALLASAQQANTSDDDEIDLRELWNAIWEGKLLIIAITFVFTVAGVAFALSQPNQYKASVLLAPAQTESGAAGLAAKFGGLASLAGVNLGGGGGDNKALLAQEVLKSRQFVANFITKHDLLVPLMAAKGWNQSSEQLALDDDIYDPETSRWMREVAPPKTAEPTMWEAYKEFSKHFSVSENKDSGYVTISFEFFSPSIAKQWVDWLVKDINNQIRLLDVKEAKESIAFLEEKLQQTSYAEMQKVFFQLIEEQTKTIMLAEVRDEYVFKTVDPAVIPEEKSKPRRAIICILFTFLGGLVSICISYVVSNRKNQ